MPELFTLIEKINIRHAQEYKMQILIAQNPHSRKPEELWKSLEKLEKNTPEEPQFDETGFEILKQRMSQNPRIIVKP